MNAKRWFLLFTVLACLTAVFIFCQSVLDRQASVEQSRPVKGAACPVRRPPAETVREEAL